MPGNDFVYTIPSYNRAEKQKTVKYLNTMGVPADRIYVFVQTKADEEKYTETIGELAQVVFRPANRGVEARNNILNALVDKTDLMMLDDDIQSIGVLQGDGLRAISAAGELDAIFRKGLGMCRAGGDGIFGVYPVYNAFFMDRSISTRVPVNTVFGFAKGFGWRYDEEYDTKEDAEMCARILASGRKILRINFVAVSADHRKTKDGYIDDWHQEENVRCVRKLVLKYPDVYQMQKGKPWEVRSLVKDKKLKL